VVEHLASNCETELKKKARFTQLWWTGCLEEDNRKRQRARNATAVTPGWQ
jgi:hypothetical protein